MQRRCRAAMRLQNGISAQVVRRALCFAQSPESFEVQNLVVPTWSVGSEYHAFYEKVAIYHEFNASLTVRAQGSCTNFDLLA